MPASQPSGPAPIMLSTYRRLNHVTQTIEALLKNDLAAESTLYVTSDGPMPGHEEQVFAVRRYLESVKGFGKLELRFFEKNDRTQIWNQRREFSSTHGRYIYLEEDCVVAPTFLRFINANLERYADDDCVFSVAGYTPPVSEIQRPSLELFRVPSYNAWGFGTWERCDKIVRSSLSAADYHETLNSTALRRKVNASIGIPFYGMLKKIAEGQLYAYDVMARLEIIKRDMVSIFPSESFVQNIGFDGSGEHCGKTDTFHVPLTEREMDGWSQLTEHQSTVVNQGFARFYGGTPKNRLRFLSKRIRGKMRVKA